jgi:NAD(P)-dependent dehydrogenase (short-subunit alcohol dehydrogenase family)
MPRALVTGAAGTFGKHIAAGLLAAGFETLCLVRDAAKGDALLASLNAGARARAVVCDLSSAASIAAAVSGALGSLPLEVLVNNAAVAPPARTEAADGTELQWATNVLAYHRVVLAALPALRAAREPRVVFVASQYAGGLDIRDACFAARAYEPHEAYRASKQANRMMAAAWAAREPYILFTSCHPGIADSNVARGLGMSFSATDEAGRAGADTPVYVATAPAAALQSGGYYVSRKLTRCAFAADAEAVRALVAVLDAAR